MSAPKIQKRESYTGVVDVCNSRTLLESKQVFDSVADHEFMSAKSRLRPLINLVNNEDQLKKPPIDFEHGLPENVPVKQEFGDLENLIQIKTECDIATPGSSTLIKQECGNENVRNEKSDLSIWIKDECLEISDTFTSRNYEDSSGNCNSIVKQENDSKSSIRINETKKNSLLETVNLPDGDDLSFVCEFRPVKTAETCERKNVKLKANSLHKCRKCSFIARGITSLSKHTSLCHAKIKCSWCNFETFHASRLNKHIQQLHVSSTYKTIDASESIAENDLDMENDVVIQVEPTENQIECDSEQNIDRSVRNDDGNSQHKCNQCDFAARGPKSLRTHVNFIHKNIKNHTCLFCEFKTAYKSSLVVHMNRRHPKTQRGHCSENSCNFTSNNRNELWKHVSETHKTRNFTKCSWCSFQTCQNAELKEHVQKVHIKSTYKSTNIQK